MSAVTQMGIVFYKNDPKKIIFRLVFPTLSDDELDGPPTDGEGRPYLKSDGTPETWTTLGVSPWRLAVMRRVSILEAGRYPLGASAP